MIKTFYWCPYISDVATVKAVLNSAKSIKRYSNNRIEPSIINVVGEWNEKKNLLRENNINLVDFKNKNIIKFLPKLGFIFSRFTYVVIFFFSVLKLHKLLKKEQPDYLIVHLITFIPLFLLIFFNYKTKFILRISGYPKLNLFRSTIWRSIKNKIYLVTCPTNLTLKLLQDKNIFTPEKLYYLPDPILEVKKINFKKKKILELDGFSKDNSILSIGRLTKQKNFNFLINCFKDINVLYPQFNLYILGEGEQRGYLQKKINQLNLKDKIFLIGYKKNVYQYLNNCKLFILTSNYEDPGFVLIEAGFMNKTVITSDCPNGPEEIIENNKNGNLFKNNSKEDFLRVFEEVINKADQDLHLKRIGLKKKCKEFTLFSHYSKLNKLLN